MNTELHAMHRRNEVSLFPLLPSLHRSEAADGAVVAGRKYGPALKR